MQKLVEQIIVDIIRQEMVLPEDSVWVRDQNKNIPLDSGIYISVGSGLNSKIIGSTNKFNNTTGNEEQSVSIAETIEIDFFSSSNDLLFRRWEVLAAINSFLSKQYQEKYNFKIFRVPTSFTDLSSVESGSNIKRYRADFICHIWYFKEKVLQSDNGDYYDDFTQRIDDEKTIETSKGLFDFEITTGD